MRRIAALTALLPLAVAGQVRTDGSLGRPAASLAGPNYVIPQSLGRLSGSNLFHSFQTFGIGGGESATFVTTTPGLANILARVTGGDVSYINGALNVASAGAAPAFWLINPAGVIFGNGASVNVPGAFHVTTANYIRFPDGDFHADLSKPSTFSALSPEAYGFLGNASGVVSIENGAIVYSAGAVDLVGGNVSIDRSQLAGGSGDIRVVAYGARAGEVGLTGPVPDAAGIMSITQGGTIGTTSGGPTKGGDVGIYAGTLLIDGTTSESETGVINATASAAPSGSIDVAVSGTATIVGGALISTRTDGPGNAGPIRFSARDLTIDGKSFDDTGIFSRAHVGSTGSAGSVDVSVSNALQLFDGAVISSDTEGAGNGGAVRVTAGTILIDGRNTQEFTAISSDSDDTATGSAGTVNVRARGLLAVVGGGEISSTSYNVGNAGSISVGAGELLLDGSAAPGFTTGIHSTAFGDAGNAGSVDVQVDGTAKILGSAEISADTWTAGSAGNVRVAAGTLLIDGGGSTKFTGISSDALGTTGRAGNVEVQAQRLSIFRGGSISSDTESDGNAGNVTVTAGDLLIDAVGALRFTGISSDAVDGHGNAGSVTVRATRARLLNGGAISSDTYVTGNAGSVLVAVTDSLAVDGQDRNQVGSRISSETFSSATGNAGQVRVEVGGALSITAGGIIGSDTFHSGNAGEVSVSAGSLRIEGRDAPYLTGISSQADPGATGNAGTVGVQVLGDLAMIGSGGITSSTFSPGRAGGVKVDVGGNLTISDGADRFVGISTNSLVPGAGPAGNVEVTVAGTLSLSHLGAIESDTLSLSDAGQVHVRAGSLQIDGSGLPGFTGISSDSRFGAGGRAGDVLVEVTGEARLLAGGAITSTTRSSGDAGSVKVHAGELLIDSSGANGISGVSTSSLTDRSGNAGQVSVSVDGSLQLRNGGVISSATSSALGRAGTVEIDTGRLLIDGAHGDGASGISARSTATASGQTGNISITASESITLSNGGQITIDNASSPGDRSGLVASQVVLNAPMITIGSGAAVSAQSSGNVDASNIRVESPGQLWLDSGAITTSANLGNGGGIAIDAGTVRLTNSLITTSVLGTRGNGGNIDLHADTLRLETGFIQANTAARNASGGDVTINVGNFIASGGNVFIGGSAPIAFEPGVFALNVIQAAAPTGLSGTIDITSPVLDTAGALAGIAVAPLDTSQLGRSPCRAGAGSSLALAGRGGLAPSARDGFRLDPPVAAAPLPPMSGSFAAAGRPCASKHAAS